jgi:hypothetical protein
MLRQRGYIKQAHADFAVADSVDRIEGELPPLKIGTVMVAAARVEISATFAKQPNQLGRLRQVVWPRRKLRHFSPPRLLGNTAQFVHRFL